MGTPDPLSVPHLIELGHPRPVNFLARGEKISSHHDLHLEAKVAGGLPIGVSFRRREGDYPI
jgi:hypothetical protein